MKARFYVEKKDLFREVLKKAKFSVKKTHTFEEGQANIESGAIQLKQYRLLSPFPRGKKIVVQFDRIKEVSLTEREVEVPDLFSSWPIGDGTKIVHIKFVELHFTDDYGVEKEMLFAPYEGTLFTIYKSEEWVKKLNAIISSD